MKNNHLYIIGILLILIGSIWLLFIPSNISSIPEDFELNIDIFSVDNFYDENINDYSGEQFSKTEFSYKVISVDNDILIINNLFDVKTLSGEQIFSVERTYGINKNSGKHVPGYGDKNREGYLFSKKGIKKGESYTYWHINYDEPAIMEFKEVEKINDLRVYKFEANYHANQTDNLGFLPEVGESRGVNLDINLIQWIEPTTGRMIKYEDNTIAYFYDLSSGERIHPWNKFNNEYQDVSINDQINDVKKLKNKILIIGFLIPIIFILIGFLSIFYAKFKPNKNGFKKQIK